MRPLIQYDLDESLTAPAGPQPDRRRPPSKKRKRNHHHTPKSTSTVPQKTPLQHWDDPGSAAVGVVYDDLEGDANPASVMSCASGVLEGEDEYGEEVANGDDDAYAAPEQGEEEEEEEEEESRPLTHEEIWDDAALIDAWNSAEAEYEAYHGTSKTWKTEPTKKSPLWYNNPYTAPLPKSRPSKPEQRSKHVPPQAPARPTDAEFEPEPDTAPLDFDTYVPTHDPSLGAFGSAHGTTAPFAVPPPSAVTVTRDEAFSNALSAMYWGGYWTAVYHCQSQTSGRSDSGPVEANKGDRIDADEDEDENADEEDLIPAQR